MADDTYERTFPSPRAATMEQQPLLGTGAEYTEEAANRTFRRVGWKILPWTFFMSAVASMQYYSVWAHAQYSTAGLLFVPYILFQIPSNVILTRVGAPAWLGAMFIGWGLTNALAVSKWKLIESDLLYHSFRLLLGAMAAGSYPGIIYYVAQFFPDSRLSHVFGISFAGSALGIGYFKALTFKLLLPGFGYFLGMYRWQAFYVLEGLPAVVLGFLMMCVQPSGPGACMTPDELMILHHEKAACQKEQGDDGGAAPRNFWRLATSVICNVKILVLLVVMVLSGILWKTLWIDAMMSDWSDVEVNGVTAALLYTLPFVMAAVGSWLFGWTSVKLKDRTIHILVLGSISGLMVVLLPWLTSVSFILGIVVLMLGYLGANGVVPSLCSMQMSFLSEDERNFGTAWVYGVASLCWWLGRMIPWHIPLWLTGGMSIVSGLIAVSLEDSVRKEYGGKRKLPSIQP